MDARRPADARAAPLAFALHHTHVPATDALSTIRDEDGNL